jgi:hypothetical protein
MSFAPSDGTKATQLDKRISAPKTSGERPNEIWPTSSAGRLTALQLLCSVRVGLSILVIEVKFILGTGEERLNPMVYAFRWSNSCANVPIYGNL